MNERKQAIKYIILDYFSALASWNLMYVILHQQVHPNSTGGLQFTEFLFAGIIAIPVYWLIIYFIAGYYRNVYLRSRLTELWQTFSNILLGVTVLFILLLNKLPDDIPGNKLFFLYFLIQFTVTYLPRLTLTTHTNTLIQNGVIGVNTLIIGSGAKALKIYREITTQKRSSGNRFSGFLAADEKVNETLKKNVPQLGTLDNLREVIKRHKIREVIIAVESPEKSKIIRIINLLAGYDIVIKAIPSMSDIVTGKIRMNSILGTPLLLVSHQTMPHWQENIKYMLDFIIALLALLLTLPLTLFLIAGIKLTSKGPVIYSHERIGRYGNPFRIYKFRSMYNDAEKNGPELSSRNDERITPFGRFMRKTKFDEIPNFINVLKGDMSLVGPRPERKYFIDKIIEKEPHYMHLLKIRPGITSWGQVKYGYAENVEQMLDRLKYDLIYLDNMSLVVDIKIIIYTMLTIIRKKGI